MRSLTSRPSTDMKQLFWISFLLTHLPGIESKDRAVSCLLQPKKVVWCKIGQDAVLPCTVTSNCLGQDLDFVWFVYEENSHRRLSLTGRYSLRGASLHISSPHSNDSGIYHCAVESQRPTTCCQHVGTGTTLVVKKQVKIMVRYVLLWTSFALLLVYSLAIVTLIILKKYGHNTKISAKMSKLGKKNSKKTSQFQNVLQELHSRGNLKKSKRTRGNHSHVEAASGECSVSSEDIYQNV